MRRLFVSALLFASTFSASAWAASWEDTSLEWGKKAGDVGSKIVKHMREPSPFTKALDKIYGEVKRQKTITDKTFVSDTDLEAIENDTQAMKGVLPPVPESLNTESAYKRIVGAADPSATVNGSDQLELLQNASDGRRKEIERLKGDRDKLSTLAKDYAATTDTAEKLSRESGKLVGDFPIEFTSQLATGRSFSLSWLAFETELVPALQERHAAANDAVKRYDETIKAAEEDLKAFDESKAFADSIWSGVPKAGASGLDASSVSGTQSARLQGIRVKMNEGNAAVDKVAGDLHKEAMRIRQAGAELGRIRGIVNLGRDALAIGSGGTAASAASDPSAPNSIRIDPKDLEALPGARPGSLR